MIEIMEKILDRINKPDDLKKLNLPAGIEIAIHL